MYQNGMKGRIKMKNKKYKNPYFIKGTNEKIIEILSN